MAGIRLDSWKSARAFKGIICDDISEFESYMPSHAVRSPLSPQPRRGRASSAAFRETNRMELEVEGLTGAAHGERSAERITHLIIT